MPAPFRITAIFLLALTACTGEEITDTGSEPVSTPLWTAADVEAQWERLIEVGLPSPYGIRDEYLAYHALGDETCPGVDTENLTSPTVTLDGCYSEDGILYAGEFVWMEEEGEYLDEHGDWFFANFGTQVADFIIESPDGTRMSGGGRLSVRRAWKDDGKIVGSSTVTGTWSYTGSEHPWFADGISSYLEIRVEGDINKNDHRLKKLGFVGSKYLLSGTYGIPGVSVHFQGLSMGGGCDRWPNQGVAAVRSDDGTWYHIDFSEHGACDACGEVIWDGREPVGQACPDFLGLLPWLDPPLLAEL